MLPARTSFRTVRPVLHVVRVGKLEQGVALAATVATGPEVAKSANVDAVVNKTVDNTVSNVESLGQFLKSLYGKGVEAAGYAEDAYTKVSPQINSAIEKAGPVLRQGADEVEKVAGPAIRQAVPVVKAEANKFLQTTGVDTKALEASTNEVGKTANDAFAYVSPVLNKAYTFVTTSDSETLLKGGAAVVGTYYLLPVAFKVLVGSLRGFSGEISPAKAIDTVMLQDDACLIDLRSAKEKAATGVPDVPGSAKGRFLELEGAAIERRLRGQLSRPESVECQITALEIKALKRVNKNSMILLLDRNGSTSKDVAKVLAGQGFKQVYVVTGGFANWSSSKLQIRNPVGGSNKMGGVIPNIIGTINTRKEQAVKTKAATK